MIHPLQLPMYLHQLNRQVDHRLHQEPLRTHCLLLRLHNHFHLHFRSLLLQDQQNPHLQLFQMEFLRFLRQLQLVLVLQYTRQFNQCLSYPFLDLVHILLLLQGNQQHQSRSIQFQLVLPQHILRFLQPRCLLKLVHKCLKFPLWSQDQLFHLQNLDLRPMAPQFASVLQWFPPQWTQLELLQQQSHQQVSLLL